MVEKPALILRYDYETQEFDVETNETGGRLSGENAVLALKVVRPELDDFLAERHTALKNLYRRVSAPHAGRVGPPRLPRNVPCPCGSGKKYKRCCGA